MRRILKTVNIIEELDIDLYKELGIGLELQDFTEPNRSEEDIKDRIGRYKDILRDFDNIKSMHGPFLDLKPASPDDEIRKISQKRYLKALSIAKELDLDYIIFHSQINPYLNHPVLEELNNIQDRDAWHFLIKESGYEGIVLIENIFEESPEMLLRRIDIIDHPQIKINLDIGHANIGSSKLNEWIEKLGEYIVYMHVHTNNGVYDTHNPLDKKEIEELYETLNKYNINPILSLEHGTEDLRKEISKYRI